MIAVFERVCCLNIIDDLIPKKYIKVSKPKMFRRVCWVELFAE